MLYRESLWFRRIVRTYVEPGSLVLNIGSSTKEFIEESQPYIKENLLEELATKDCRIKNVDLKQDAGVDLVGDVTDPEFADSLRSLKPGFVVCSNLLEHLENRQAFCDALAGMLTSQTRLAVSVPHRFPYHADPIDTLYRPNVTQLRAAFPGLRMIEGQIVNCGYYCQYVTQQLAPIHRVYRLGRILTGIPYAMVRDRERFPKLLWQFRRISATCALFQHAN